MYFDFVKYWNYHKSQQYALSREPLYKALGLKKGVVSKIWDLTCGTGKDSILMLYFGADIVAFERSPVIARLLEDAYQQALKDLNLSKVIEQRFHLNFCDPRSNSWPRIDETPDIIFIDPMYTLSSTKPTKSLPRKEMQIFRDVVGNDPDADDLFCWAKEHNPKRIVVKRAAKAPVLAPNPQVSYRGKSTRYDMYKSL
ncbi:MAG: class I SAM-dependent methyltransferase [Bacteriovoracaceae bacterium]|nr:class I SAM-dependent methyltransferase [Bacteriovoracaceae bacterium]